MFTHQLYKLVAESASRRGGESDEDYSWLIHARGEYQPAEVLVLGKEYAVFGKRKLHQLFVYGTVLKVAHREHIVASRPEARTAAKSQHSSARKRIAGSIGN